MATRHSTTIELIQKAFRNRRNSRRPEPGQEIGRLTVVRYAGHNQYDQSFWECRCSCGRTTLVSSVSLRVGGRGHKTRSCGCLKIEALIRRSTIHGASRGGQRTKEFGAWVAMRQRCQTDANYLLRGIVVCTAWESSFESFLAEIGPCPSPQSKYTVERKNNHLGYEPGNVMWATRSQQNRNKSDNRYLELDGLRLCLSDWATHLGLSPNTIRNRLARGWTVRRALTTRNSRRAI